MRSMLCRSTKTFLVYIIGSLLWVTLFSGTSHLLSQRNYLLSGQIGYGYYSANPFVSNGDTWHYNQLFVSLNLSGHIWDPRFLTFNLGGDYGLTNFSENWAGTDSNNLGYRLALNFLPRSKINFGIRYGRHRIDFADLPANALSTHTLSMNKDFYLNIFRIKFLPNIRIDYSDRDYYSGLEDDMKESDRRLDVSAVKKSGISHFDLTYRLQLRENELQAFDTSHQNLRVSERLDFDPDNQLVINSQYSDYTVTRSDDSSVTSRAGGLFVSYNRHFSEKLFTNLRYHFNLRAGDSYRANSHRLTLRANYDILPFLVIVPEIGYLTENIDLDEGEDRIEEPSIGARLVFHKDLKAIRLSTSAGLHYRNYRSDLYGQTKDVSQSFSLGLDGGRPETLLGSLTYTYNRFSIDEPGTAGSESPIFEPIGRKQDYHRIRLVLRSRSLSFVNIYLYSDYSTYHREYSIEGISDTGTFTNGVTLDFKQVSFHADYGISRFNVDQTETDYKSYSLILDVKLIRGLFFRASNKRRTRTDIPFVGDYELVQEAYLSYNIGKFSLSAIYRRIRAERLEVTRDDDRLSIKISRVFGAAF